MKHKPTILVADDEIQNIELLEAHLVPQGYKIVRAANGEDALKKLSANPIDLILLDVMMPGIDGFEVTRRIRQDNAHRMLPIVLVTVLWETEDRVKGIEAGCDDFISKPINLVELTARVRSLLKVKAYNDLLSNYQKELESEVSRRSGELKHAMEKFRNLFNNAEVGMFRTRLDGSELLDMNEKFLEIFSSTREEMQGYSSAAYWADPREREEMLRMLREEGRVTDFECRMLNKQGEVRNCLTSVRAYPEKGILEGSILDITARKLIEEALLTSEGFLHTLVHTIPDMIWFKDKDGIYRSGNTMFERFFGAREADIIGKTDYDFVDHELADSFRCHDREAMAAGKPTSKEEWITFADDGHRAFVDTIKTPMYDSAGTLIGVLGIGRDITERKLAEGRIKKALAATVQAIAVTVETRDPYTAGHQQRAADLARAIATEMNLSIDMIDGIRMAAAIHDLGKISIPAEILSKPVKPTNIEFSIIKIHPQTGYDILKDIDFPWPVARMVLEHHERMNGSGYPNGLKGEDILMGSRILAVADVVEAMASHRPYRQSLGLDEAIEEIEKNRGTLYDDTVVGSCLRLFREKGFELESA
jgi:PAS domain S-box-containing protein